MKTLEDALGRFEGASRQITLLMAVRLGLAQVLSDPKQALNTITDQTRASRIRVRND